MGHSIDKITLKGFKSIRELDEFPLGPINILIGSNGCGKSNFISFFSLLRELVEGRLNGEVNRAGGADMLMFLGPKQTTQIETQLHFGQNTYEIDLEPTNDDRLIFKDETIRFHSSPSSGTYRVNRSIGKGHRESKLREHSESGRNRNVAQHIYNSVSSWIVYHFHDTSNTALMRRSCSIRDNERLRSDAANLAPFLLHLKEEEKETYRVIIETIRLVAPFFQDFKLRKQKKKDDKHVLLEWVQVGSDYPFHPSQLSDGTLRFIALATCLLQPAPPATILIDEPELGLHPYALEILASLILQAEAKTQVIVSTQSAQLLNSFTPDQIIIVERHNGETLFKRLEEDSLETWLTDYTLGEVWQKNIIGGGPMHE